MFFCCPRFDLVDWVRVELTHNSLQDCRSAKLSYQPMKIFGGGKWTCTTTLRFMGPLLRYLSYTAVKQETGGRRQEAGTMKNFDVHWNCLLFPAAAS